MTEVKKFVFLLSSNALVSSLLKVVQDGSYTYRKSLLVSYYRPQRGILSATQDGMRFYCSCQIFIAAD